MIKGNSVRRYKCFVCGKPVAVRCKCICGSQSLKLVYRFDFDGGFNNTVIKVKKVTPPKRVVSPNKSLPVQPTPITIDNFFISTTGVFTEIDSIPEGFTKFFQSKESEYWCDSYKLVLIRVSNHWGYNIKFCAWHLRGYPNIISYRWQKQFGKQMRIGFIRIDELQENKVHTSKKISVKSSDVDLPIIKESRERVVEQYRKIGFKID